MPALRYPYHNIEQVRHALALLPEDCKVAIVPARVRGKSGYRVLTERGFRRSVRHLWQVETALRQLLRPRPRIYSPNPSLCSDGFVVYSAVVAITKGQESDPLLRAGADAPTPLHALCAAYARAYSDAQRMQEDQIV